MFSKSYIDTSGIVSFEKHNNGWVKGKTVIRLQAIALSILKKNQLYDPCYTRLPHQAMIDFYSTLEYVFGPREVFQELIKWHYMNQHVCKLDTLDRIAFLYIDKFYIKDQQAAEEIPDERFAIKCAFFSECVDAIANSTVQPSEENYRALIDHNPHRRVFDNRIIEHIVGNSSMNGTVINLLRSLKDALLEMVEGPFPFAKLKDKMSNDTIFWTWTLKRVSKFKEEPTKDTFTCMVLNEAQGAYDEMLSLHLIVEVSLLVHPLSPPTCVEKYSSCNILKNFYLVYFNKEEDAALTDINYQLFAFLSASYLCFNYGHSLNESLNILFQASNPADCEVRGNHLWQLYIDVDFARCAVEEAFQELFTYSKKRLGFTS